jgi:valyl-tRNA synthetase
LRRRNMNANRAFMTELAKTFEPGPIEARWYAHWEGQGSFRPERNDATPFTIVMPPPNVTGSLHIGHALDITLQDVLVRHARMQGKDSLWVVGTDHAGIATQMVVERNLDSQGIKRAEIGREAFLEHVWEWKAQSGGQITRQLRRLGASCDWSNERFTMDEGFSRAVTHVFVELHRRGLAYRDKRLVNWDPKFQTAISDLEVETREVAGHFWHLKYPLADGSGAIHVATTRPETMLADMAVAVHPDDERYQALVGKQVKLPITGRLIPIIADVHADPELGSGAVKVTPGHDFNDFEVGRRAGMKPAEMLNMFDASAHIVQTADGLVPEELIGLSSNQARKRVIELLEAEGALEKVEDRIIATPYGDRSGVVIEPWLTDQWYVNVMPLAERAMAATRAGEIKIVPETWSKTWFNWLENIQPWCVSRQLWWGHRIPAWYGPKIIDGNLHSGRSDAPQFVPHEFVAETEAEAIEQATRYYQEGGFLPDGMISPVVQSQDEAFRDLLPAIWRDDDVLDTWFSSALWPFATLGWPNETDDLKRHYPNDVLISGFDILFFWDARMAMQGIEFLDAAPWKTLYLHGLVRDAHGQKMSKSKGNTVDPLGLIDKYGADALRFTLAAMESQGRDIKLDEKRVEGYRNFATKLWNAARFLQGNGVGASTSIAAPEASLPVNRWIIGEVVETLARLDKAFAELRFDDMADAIYHFTWGTFCDWYVELVKGAWDEETRAVAAWAFDQILVMLHPFMPFVTEELWHSMGERQGPNGELWPLITAKWPAPDAEDNSILFNIGAEAVDAKVYMNWVVGTIMAVRAAKVEAGIAPGQRLTAYLEDVSSNLWSLLSGARSMFDRVGRLDIRESGEPPTAGVLRIPGPGATLAVPLEGVIDVEAYRASLIRARDGSLKDRDSLAARLANPAFAERAKPEAVEKARADHDARAAEAERLSAALSRLG